MHIGFSSPVTISEFYDYLDDESKIKAQGITGLRAPAVDALILELLRRGHKISIYTLDFDVNDIVVLKGDNITIFVGPNCNHHWWKPFGVFTYRTSILKKCMRLETSMPDVIHAHWTHDYALAPLFGAKTTPLVVTVRDWAPSVLKHFKCNYGFYIHYIMDYIVFKSSRPLIITNSAYMANSIKKRWHRDVEYIMNPMAKTFEEVVPKQDHNKFVVISITNRICKLKNIERLVEAFAKVRTTNQNVELHLLGSDFHLENADVKRWNSNGLGEGVFYEGHVNHNQLLEWFSKADLLVHPSLEESFGNIFVEAMSQKVAVLGGKESGAVPYLLNHGEYGFLCDVTNVDNIAATIQDIMKDPEVCNQKIESAYNFVKESCLVSSVADKTMEIYNGILK